MIHYANIVLNEFHQAAQISSLNTAISIHRDALRLRGGAHIQRSASLNGLALALHARYYRRGQPQDQDEAISLLQESLVLHSESHSNRLALLSNLSAALLTRFGRTGQLADIRDVVSFCGKESGLNLGESMSMIGATENSRNSELRVRVTAQHWWSLSQYFLLETPGACTG
jgi:hypothetical protein